MVLCEYTCALCNDGVLCEEVHCTVVGYFVNYIYMCSGGVLCEYVHYAVVGYFVNMCIVQ